MSRRHSGVAAAAILAAAAVALSSCSSSNKSDSSSGATSTGSSSAKAATGSPIKIGIAAGLTGSSSSISVSPVDTAKAWADSISDSGGINGHPVQISVEDTKSDPATALAAAKDLVQVKKVDAVLVLDPVSEAQVAPYLQQVNMPLLGAGYSASVYGGTLKNVFAPETGILAGNAGAAVAAKAVGAKVFGDVYCAEAPVCAQVSPILSAGAKSQGIQYSGGLSVSASAPDYTAQCLQLMSKGTDFLLLTLTSATGARVASDCLKQGYKGAFGAISGTVVLKDLSNASGATFAGILNSFPWWLNDPAVVAYRSAMEKYEPGADYKGATQTAVWANLELLGKALSTVSASTAITPTVVIDAYGQVKSETLSGLLPAPVTYTAGEPAKPLNCFWLYMYKAGAADPTILPAQGASGNGQSGDLATSCYSGS
jgi:branched-chain amino acid transport system substrate-binding protein